MSLFCKQNLKPLLLVRTRAGGKTVHELVSRKRVDDNQDHVIRVWRQRRQVKVRVRRDIFLDLGWTQISYIFASARNRQRS